MVLDVGALLLYISLESNIKFIAIRHHRFIFIGSRIILSRWPDKDTASTMPGPSLSISNFAYIKEKAREPFGLIKKVA